MTDADVAAALPDADVVLTAFADLSMNYTLTKHKRVMTCEEQALELGDHLEGFLTKNLFFKDKKGRYYLVTSRDTRAIDAKTLGKRIKTKNLRLAPDDQLESILRVARGSVTPLAIMNDVETKVTLILDASLVANPSAIINVHPLSCDQTVSMTAQDLQRFAETYHHTPVIIDFDASVASTAGEGSSVPKAGKPTKKPIHKDTSNHPEKKKETKSKEGISVGKWTHFAEWYTEVITKAQLIDYYDISGCYILRPWSYSIWEHLRNFLDAEIKAIGVQNCYFPMFVSQEKLAKEEAHLEGFAAEVAWVTKSGQTDLKEPIAIRPTSETIMYPAFKNWIRSHRDLPLKLNQWNNVVRWEFKNPTPFLRTREFLWQEGHTVHLREHDADAEVAHILQVYARAYADLLAVPMIAGRKSDSEKFAGATYTTTIEGFIPATGRGIQAATSHALGQTFSRMFGISVEAPEAEDDDTSGKKIVPFQNSWGFTTRSIGVMIMIHGDDRGLVCPPRVAPIQVVIVPIVLKDDDSGQTTVLTTCADIAQTLTSEANVRVHVDDRLVYTPGWKYNHWEVKGVPLRVEIGPRDVAQAQVTVVRRDTGAKVSVAWSRVALDLPALLETMQNEMLQRATAERDAHIRRVTEWKDFVPALQDGCLVLTPFCNVAEWEDRVKDRSREESLAAAGQSDEAENVATSAAAKSLCLPFHENDKPIPDGTMCFISGLPATCYMLWGRSY